jgi:hypothetical protein
LKRLIPLMVALSMIVALSPPALAVSGAVAAQPYASDTAANPAQPAAGSVQKTGHKPAQHKKKKSSFKSKMSDQVKKLRAKLPAFLNSFNKGKSQP